MKEWTGEGQKTSVNPCVWKLSDPGNVGITIIPNQFPPHTHASTQSTIHHLPPLPAPLPLLPTPQTLHPHPLSPPESLFPQISPTEFTRSHSPHSPPLPPAESHVLHPSFVSHNVLFMYVPPHPPTQPPNQPPSQPVSHTTNRHNSYEECRVEGPPEGA